MEPTSQPAPGSGWSNWPTAGFRVDAAEGYVVVSAYGEIDVNNLQGFANALAHAGKSSPRVVVDLAHVTFIDSSGLGALIAARRAQARSAGGSLVLVEPPEMLRRVLATVQLQQTLPMFDSLQQAVDATRGPNLTTGAGDAMTPPAPAQS